MIVCPNCGRANRDDARYCDSCRVNLGDAAPKDAHGRPQYARNERRTLWQRVMRWLKHAF